MENERTFVFLLHAMTDEIPLSKSERTRAEIIKAAHDLFLQKGYHGTSMRQIAKSAGIALGGIYNHFASKDEIFRDVVLAYHPYHEIIPVLATTEHENFEEFIRHAVHLIDESLTRRPDIMNLMFIEMVEFQSKHIPELLEQFFPMVMQIVQRFTAAGTSLRPMPLPMMMRTFIGLLLGYFITKNALGERTPPEFRDHALDYFIDVYLYGILKTEPIV